MRILAHGDHPLTTVWEALGHQFTEFDHLATMAAAIGLAVIAVGARSMLRRRSAQARAVGRHDPQRD